MFQRQNSSVAIVKSVAIFTLLAGIKLAAVGLTLSAQNWPQWRGPHRDGGISAFVAPKSWPEQLKRVWKVTVGEGHSSPVAAGSNVFVLTRQQEREVVSSFELATGKLRWQQSYPALYSMHPAAVSHGKGPKSTPLLYGDRLYTLGISGILSCFDAKTGRLHWRKEFTDQFRTTSPLYGAAMSPMIDNGLLIVHVGGHDSGALTAFQADTGQVKWSWTGDGPGYASPIVVDLDGTRQVITQTQRYLVGISAAGGELLWSIPFTTDFDQNIITPIAYRQMLVFSGYAKGTMAIRVSKQGNRWSTERLWHNPQISMYMSSPVVSGDFLYGLSHRNKGQFFCLDIRTGETRWTSSGREGENAAVLLAGDLLFFLTNNAELIIAKADAKGFEPLKRYSVADSPTWAHPVIWGNRILVKDAATLSLREL